MSEYSLSSVESDYDKLFVGTRPMHFFVTYLGAGERLSLTESSQRGNYLRDAPKEPLQWLEFDEQAEAKIRSLFRSNFDADLILNTLRGTTIGLHVVPTQESPPDYSAKNYSRWLAGMPLLERQGDGIRSFIGAALSLVVHPRNIVLLDEPEAFLHPPQARKLASFIARESSLNSQVLLATHSDEIVRAMLDSAGDRVIVARIMREKDRNYVSVLKPNELVELWTDPTLRTSDVLSALFHQVAIICEGDSDARFYKALLDATTPESNDPDAKFYYFGGKDRIPSVASALIGLNVPVVSIVDIDVLSEKTKFYKLVTTFGGNISKIEDDYNLLVRSVDAKKVQAAPAEIARELARLANLVRDQGQLTKPIRDEISGLIKQGSNWQRLKDGGYKMFVDAPSIQAFKRIDEACRDVGIIINTQGELERFCPEISSTRKGEWLAQVLRRDLGTEQALEDARKFADTIRSTMETTLKRTVAKLSDKR